MFGNWCKYCDTFRLIDTPLVEITLSKLFCIPFEKGYTLKEFTTFAKFGRKFFSFIIATLLEEVLCVEKQSGSFLFIFVLNI